VIQPLSFLNKGKTRDRHGFSEKFSLTTAEYS